MPYRKSPVSKNVKSWTVQYEVTNEGDLSMEKEQVLRLLPKDKFDISTIGELVRLKEEEIQKILPELINWIVDANWLVATPVAIVLAKNERVVLPYLIKLLAPEHEDDEFKFFIINLLVPMLSTTAQAELLPSILRIYENPTKLERIGSYFAAESYLEQLQKNGSIGV